MVGGWYLAKRWRSWVAVSTTAAFRPPVSLRTYLSLSLPTPYRPLPTPRPLRTTPRCTPPPHLSPFHERCIYDTGCITPSTSLRCLLDEGVRGAARRVSVCAAWWMNGILEGRKWRAVLPSPFATIVRHPPATQDSREDAPRARATVAHVEVRTSCAGRI